MGIFLKNKTFPADRFRDEQICLPDEDLLNIFIEVLSFPIQDSNGWRASASRLADDLLKRRSKLEEQDKAEQTIHQLKEASHLM